MGHHGGNITVEPANNAYSTSPTPRVTSALTVITTNAAAAAAAAAGSVLRDAIGATRPAPVVAATLAGRVGNGGGGHAATTRTAGAAAASMRGNGTAAPDRTAGDYYYYYAYDNATDTALFFPLNGTVARGGPDARFDKSACEWIPAQQSLFQFSNICFLTAFIVPRSYKLSVLSLR